MSASPTAGSRWNRVWFVGSPVALLAPLGIVAFLGAGAASLWLDEITYYRLQSDIPLRAAEIGRAGSALAPYFSNFLYCDIQRAFQSLVVAIPPTRPGQGPEWLVRTLSLLAYAATAILIVTWGRRQGSDRPTSLLGGLLFAGTPIFLYYAFEGRVYAFVSLLVVALLAALEEASRKGGPGRLTLVALLAVACAGLHLWTVCLFLALFGLGLVEVFRSRRSTPLVRACLASSLPAIAVVGLQFAYMRATQPPDPLFRLFQKQPLVPTLVQTATSIFEGPTQVQHVYQGARPLSFVLLSALLLALLTVSTCRSRGTKDGFEPRHAAWTALGALAISVALAATVGHFVHGRYQVPLVAVLFWAVARGLSGRRDRLLALLLVAAELVLLPEAAAAIRAKSNNGEIAALVLGKSDRPSAAVIVQHGVVSGYPAPHHTIGLDFYLNDLHPGQPAVPILELPELRSTNGDHGTYRYFNGGDALLARMLEVPLDAFRAWARKDGRPDVWVVHPLWPFEPSYRQVAALLGILTRESGYEVTGRFVVPGYPRAEVVHLVRASGR